MNGSIEVEAVDMCLYESGRKHVDHIDDALIEVKIKEHGTVNGM